MKLLLERLQLDQDVTIGSLGIDGAWLCWTCEDAVRDGPKVPWRTAIPFGNYPINITWSPRFQRFLPLLSNVTGFEGIRIHPGNDANDTEGCILPGFDRLAKSVGRSRAAFQALFAQVMSAEKRKEAVMIDVVKG